jgi:hypothetical protein
LQRPAYPMRVAAARNRFFERRASALLRCAVLGLLLCALVGEVSAAKKKKKKQKKKQKRTPAEWAEAMKAVEREEMDEYETERKEQEEEINKHHGMDLSDPKKWIDEMGGGDKAAELLAGMGGGSMASPAMGFIYFNDEQTREENEEMVVQWRDLLMTAGFDVQPYMVEDNMALLNLKEKWKVMELKDFVLDPYFTQGKVKHFEINNKKWYPAGSDGDIKDKAAKKKKAEEAAAQEQLKLADGEIASFKKLVLQLVDGNLTIADARKQMKQLRKELPLTTPEKEIRAAGYYLKLMNQLRDAAAKGTKLADWAHGAVEELNKESKEGLVVDVERKKNILAAFVPKKSGGKTKKKKKKKKASKMKKKKDL